MFVLAVSVLWWIFLVCLVMGIGAWLFNTVYWFWPGVFDVERSLPLHVCDLTLLAIPIALLTRARWSLAFVWFAGVGLSSQGFVTPVLRAGPATIEFWNFWVTHGAVVGGGFYIVLGLGWRPTWRDFAMTIGIMLAYVAAMLALNVGTGWNSGYVGPVDAEGTVIELLGPWPWRIAPLSGLAIALMAGLMLPFLRFRDPAARPGSTRTDRAAST